jgi:hypothetical protein
MATCLGEAYDHEVDEIDNDAIRAVVLELMGYLEDGEVVWREKVRAGWWPWHAD